MVYDVLMTDAGGVRLQRSVLSEGTYEALRAMVVTFQIAPTARVNIDVIARTLGVSQTPVREALAKLESDGLVEKEPLRGYRTTALLTADEFNELFEFRGIVEPAAAELAAQRTDQELAGLAAEIDAAERATATAVGDPYEKFIEHDTRFHTLIAHLSGNRYLEQAYARTHVHLHLYRLYQASRDTGSHESSFVSELFQDYYTEGNDFRAIVEHKRIVVSIAAHDGAAAAALMRDHIESSRQRVRHTTHGLTRT